MNIGASTIKRCAVCRRALAGPGFMDYTFLCTSRRGFIHTGKQRLQGIASLKKEALEMLLFSQLHDWLKCRARSGSFAAVPQG